jgi:hypothetical protein
MSLSGSFSPTNSPIITIVNGMVTSSVGLPGMFTVSSSPVLPFSNHTIIASNPGEDYVIHLNDLDKSGTVKASALFAKNPSGAGSVTVTLNVDANTDEDIIEYSIASIEIDDCPAFPNTVVDVDFIFQSCYGDPDSGQYIADKLLITLILSCVPTTTSAPTTTIAPTTTTMDPSECDLTDEEVRESLSYWNRVMSIC